MRPHVEFVHVDDLVWHPAELPAATGRAAQRNLSYDEEDGSASAQVRFETDWHRPTGSHNADTEWFVLVGEVAVGDTRLGVGGYFRAPKGMVVPGMSAAAGTVVLLFRQYGDWGFEIGASSHPTPPDARLVLLDTSALAWQPVATPGEIRDGLSIKLLHRDEETGFYTRMIKAAPGLRGELLEHHPVFEEMYCLAGRVSYNFGVLVPGTYFFRPPWIKHGFFVNDEREGSTALLRSDGDLANYYTSDARIDVHGTAENYSPETQGPVLGSPVRSRSAGAWTEEGR